MALTRRQFLRNTFVLGGTAVVVSLMPPGVERFLIAQASPSQALMVPGTYYTATTALPSGLHRVTLWARLSQADRTAVPETTSLSAFPDRKLTEQIGARRFIKRGDIYVGETFQLSIEASSDGLAWREINPPAGYTRTDLHDDDGLTPIDFNKGETVNSRSPVQVRGKMLLHETATLTLELEAK